MTIRRIKRRHDKRSTAILKLAARYMMAGWAFAEAADDLEDWL